MKIRTDFVTNSSSSSFIIGKKGDGFTKNDIYLAIKTLYKSYLENRDKLISVVENYNITWDAENTRFMYKEYGKLTEELMKKRREINSRLEKDFGFDVHACFHYDFEWLKYDTYEEFLKYFENKAKETNNGFGSKVPFEIVDFETDTEMPDGKSFKDSFDYQEIVDWYLPCLLFPSDAMDYDINGNFIGDCHACPFHEKKELCEKLKENMKNGRYTMSNLVLEILGKIGVISYCGLIPDYVVQKLGKVSNVFDNHMG